LNYWFWGVYLSELTPKGGGGCNDFWWFVGKNFKKEKFLLILYNTFTRKVHLLISIQREKKPKNIYNIWGINSFQTDGGNDFSRKNTPLSWFSKLSFHAFGPLILKNKKSEKECHNPNPNLLLHYTLNFLVIYYALWFVILPRPINTQKLIWYSRKKRYRRRTYLWQRSTICALNL